MTKLIDLEEKMNADEAVKASSLTSSFQASMAVLCGIAIAALRCSRP